ncbi:MAG: GNAT family N-acetyltransferase [Anaerolineae bacterium]|nr:GNAT family N-acetyltransferase [Anaerolineae bacterium]
MTLETPVEETETSAGRIRRLDPARDLGCVADLITEAFADDMDARGRAALRELRWLSRLSPLVWWLAQVDPTFSDAVNGFVWQVPAGATARRGAEWSIVGNVNVNRAPGSHARLIICNVVVAQDHRRQGIARRLTERAVTEAEGLGGQEVVLQVFRHNQPALHLYTSLGFQEAGGEVDLLADVPRPVAVVDAPGYTIRRWQPEDGEAVYHLARRAIPHAIQWVRPIRRDVYWPDWGQRAARWLGDLFTGRRFYRLVALHQGQPVALAVVTVAFRAPEHRLEILVDPAHAGQVEGGLISRALYLLAALPLTPIHATTYTSHEAALKVLHGYGFREQRALLTLVKSLPRGEEWHTGRPHTGSFFEIAAL